jgi:hypothetical protein
MTKAAWFLVTASWLFSRAVESENLVIDTFEPETMEATE